MKIIQHSLAILYIHCLLYTVLVASDQEPMVIAQESMYQFEKMGSITHWAEMCCAELSEFSKHPYEYNNHFKTSFCPDVIEDIEPVLSKKEIQSLMTLYLKKASYVFNTSVNQSLKKELIQKLLASDTFHDLQKKSQDGVQKIDGNAICTVLNNNYFVCKRTLPIDAKLALFGDLHGSIHSLLRNLLRLKEISYISDQWKLQQNNYLVFLGDFVDRGCYGIECWCTIMKLAIENPEQVIIVRGNHEDQSINNKYGFKQECEAKYSAYSEDSVMVKNMFDSFSISLPVAVFIAHDNSNTDKEYIQLSHGGIEPRFETKKFLQSSEQVAILPSHHFDAHACGFCWSDFTWKNHPNDSVYLSMQYEKKSYGWAYNYCRGGEPGFMANHTDTQFYLQQSGVKAFFRGHQDRFFGFKLMICNPEKNVHEHVDYSGKMIEESLDLTDWRRLEVQDNSGNYVFIHEKYPRYSYTGIPMEEFINKEYTAPVFTISTAAEGRELESEGFLLVSMAERIEAWHIRPHVFATPQYMLNQPNRRYLYWYMLHSWKSNPDWHSTESTGSVDPVIFNYLFDHNEDYISLDDCSDGDENDGSLSLGLDEVDNSNHPTIADLMKRQAEKNEVHAFDEDQPKENNELLENNESLLDKRKTLEEQDAKDDSAHKDQDLVAPVKKKIKKRKVIEDSSVSQENKDDYEQSNFL